MLDGLLGRGFASKCKSLIKLTRSRIDVIRRKRTATQKFLKKDVADLLSNGLDINAYGRADGLLAELNVLYCYDYVEQCCSFVLKHLSVMQKLRDCPEDCREAVSSLMFAAARFSDLPELRDLRHMFQERYGNSLEYFVNQELVEKLSLKPSTMEKKIQLMQDIASEFSIKWDARTFQQRMLSKPSTSAPDQPKSYGYLNISNDKYKSINGKDTIPNNDKDLVSYKDGLECISNGYRLNISNEDNASKRDKCIPQSRQALSRDGLKPLSGREESILKMDKRDFSLQGRQEVVGDKHEISGGKGDTALKAVRVGSSAGAKKMEYNDGPTFKPHGGRENAVPKRESEDGVPYENPSIAPIYAGQHLKSNGNVIFDSDNCRSQHNDASSTRKLQEEEIPKLNPYYNNALPPPYVKPNVKSKDSKHGANLGSSHPGFDSNGVSKDSSLNVRANVGDASEQIVRYTELYYKDDDDKGNPIPKPRSVRRRHVKESSAHDAVGNVGDVGVVKRKSRSKRRDDSKRGLQILVGDEQGKNNEEERIIDKLLMHYSKKPSTYEEGMVRRKSKSRHAGEGPQNLRRDGSDEMSEMVTLPARSISLPNEQAASSETTKVFARAASFQPDKSNAARHVHPKLPDYDDLAARFAALKGR
ncbi:hypothetical protein ACOSP7_015400 [Xanthoceras sorbifolium]